MVETMGQHGGCFQPGLDDAELLEAVMAHYRRSLADTPSVHAWLVEHGVTVGETVETFGLGWSDRTLGLSLPIGARVAGRELRGRLQGLGVLRSSGHEQFRGCLVVPVRDVEGRIVQCYGRRINRPQQRGEAVPVEVLWLSAEFVNRSWPHLARESWPHLVAWRGAVAAGSARVPAEVAA